MSDAESLFTPEVQLDVNGQSLHVRRAGNPRGPGVVLVHGIGASHRYFVPLADELARDYDVTILDLPGYGSTSDPSHTLSLVELGDIVAAYIRQTYGQPVMVVGHSMGCQIVAHALRLHPDVCEGVVLIGPTVNKSERRLWLQAWRLTQDMVREPLRVCVMLLGDYWQMGFRRYLRTTRFMIRDAIEETLHQTTRPVLIIRGGRDPIVPKSWTEAIARRLRDVHTVEIPAAPHVVQYSKASEVAEVFRSWVTQLRR